MPAPEQLKITRKKKFTELDLLVPLSVCDLKPHLSTQHWNLYFLTLHWAHSARTAVNTAPSKSLYQGQQQHSSFTIQCTLLSLVFLYFSAAHDGWPFLSPRKTGKLSWLLSHHTLVFLLFVHSFSASIASSSSSSLPATMLLNSFLGIKTKQTKKLITLSP